MAVLDVAREPKRRTPPRRNTVVEEERFAAPSGARLTVRLLLMLDGGYNTRITVDRANGKRERKLGAPESMPEALARKRFAMHIQHVLRRGWTRVRPYVFGLNDIPAAS